jgi:hypothetical protein
MTPPISRISNQTSSATEGKRAGKSSEPLHEPHRRAQSDGELSARSRMYAGKGGVQIEW